MRQACDDPRRGWTRAPRRGNCRPGRRPRPGTGVSALGGRTANTELIEFARQLRPRYRTGILSNSFVGAREREQAAYGFEDLVGEIIYSHECGMSKPDPGIYTLTCTRLGVEPAQMAFLDDSQACVEGARQVGIHAVLYRDNAQAIGDIEELLGP
jgi:FMN phosphatase YigB (HAD superfamily)